MLSPTKLPQQTKPTNSRNQLNLRLKVSKQINQIGWISKQVEKRACIQLEVAEFRDQEFGGPLNIYASSKALGVNNFMYLFMNVANCFLSIAGCSYSWQNIEYNRMNHFVLSNYIEEKHAWLSKWLMNNYLASLIWSLRVSTMSTTQRKKLITWTITWL